jgi:hypothetical protein
MYSPTSSIVSIIPPYFVCGIITPKKTDYLFSIIWDDRGGTMDSTKTGILESRSRRNSEK